MSYSIELDAKHAELMVLIDNGSLEQAIADIEQSLFNCSEPQRVVLLSTHCSVLAIVGQPFAGLQLAMQARELAQQLANPLLIAESGLALSFALQGLDEHAHAIEVAEACLHIGETEGDLDCQARAKRSLGISFSVLGRHEQAQQQLTAAIAMFEADNRSPSRLHHARYSLLTAVSRAASAQSGATVQHIDLLRQWQDFAETVHATDMHRLAIMAMGNIGVAARYAGQWPLAISALTQARDAQIKMGLRAHVAASEGHIGATLAAMNETEQAVDAYKRCIEWSNKGSPRALASAWSELSELHEQMGDLAQALKAVREARKLEAGIDDQAAVLAAARVEQAAQIQQLSLAWRQLANEDALTGLANRRCFEQSFTCFAQSSPGQTLVLALFDLDHFKVVNDTHGHATGDAVLKQFATLLKEAATAGSLTARLGGEEFVWLLHSPDETSAQQTLRDFIYRVSQFTWSALADALKVTVSAGAVCVVGEDAANCSAVDLLAIADRRLYRAKSAGRDRLVDQD
jgi:diguanylate cyclase (GGDEF)-like protein